MTVSLERAEFGPDRQFVDAAVQLPDDRPGWAAVLQGVGAERISTPRQPCSADHSRTAHVRFYPFLPPGEFQLLAGLVPPDAEFPSQGQRTVQGAFARIGSASVPPLELARAAAWLRGDGADLQQAASRAMMPLCVNLAGTPCFWPVQGASPRRAAVLSIPKAGTYLVAKLLENLGMVNCKVHVGRGHLSDWRLVRETSPLEVMRHLDLAYSCRLVLPGQSMASHMKREQASETTLYEFDKIFVYREMRAVLVSSFRATLRSSRFKQLEHELQGAKPAREIADNRQGLVAWLGRALDRLLNQYHAVSGWHDHPEVCRVAFEDIVGDAGPERQREVVASIAARCGVESAEAKAPELLAKTIGAETLTYSGERTVIGRYWSPRAERMFRDAGLDKFNQKFGYPPEPPASASSSSKTELQA